MNWLLILVLVLLVGNAIWGYKKGLLRTAFSLVSWILVLGMCYFVTPAVVDIVMEQTDVVAVVHEQISAKLNETFDGSTYAQLEAAIPEELKQVLLEKNGDFTQDMEGVTLDVLLWSQSIVWVALYCIVSVVIAVVARLAVLVVDMVLGIASKLPLIGSVDTILGAALGAVKGLVWCWLVLAVIAMLALTGTNTEYISLVQQSSVLTWLYDNNIIVNMVLQSM